VPKISLPGTELNYERGGEGEPLLLIQGMTANLLAWGRPFSSLLKESFDVISFDNRGMGLSSPVTEAFSIAEMAADTAALLDALEIESAHVLGISMGGMIAQELALAEPERVRSLTLGCSYCGGPGSQLLDPADFQKLAEAMASGDGQRVYRAMWELNVSPAFAADEGNYAGFTAMTEALPASRRTIAFQLQAVAAHDTSARLPNVTAPTLVVHGTADRILGHPNGPLIASLIPGARLETLDDVGHMFWWEEPGRSAELIRDHALAPA
jgi:3-oxoadipate enol-lactonase